MRFDGYKYILVGVVTAYLNENLFYLSGISTIINICLFLFGIGLICHNRRAALVYIFITGIILSVRPRELHLIPIDIRGSFEYYSFASQKIFGATYHTWLLLLYGLRYTRNFKSHGIWMFILFLILMVVTTFIGLAIGKSVIWGIRFDIRWLVFLIIGMGIYVDKDDFILVTKWILNTAFICLIIYLFLDIKNGVSKFDYSPDLVLVLPFLLFQASIVNSWKLKRVLIPGSRTDMLLYGMTWIKNWRSIILVVVMAGSVLLVVSSLGVREDSYLGYLQRKSSIFYNLSVDKSSKVRILEFEQVNSSNFFSLLCGNGFGSYIDLRRINISLDLADFSRLELAEMKGIQPHFFVTYLLLKLGIIGTILFISYTMVVIRDRSVKFFVLIIGMLFGFYWIPMVAFMFGIVLRNGDSIYSRA